MARGTESKNTIFSKLQEIYPGAFWEDANKILRIPMTENGERVEVKVTLTAAKNNLGDGEVESAFAAPPVSSFNPGKTVIEPTSAILEPTQEEKDNVAALLRSLNL